MALRSLEREMSVYLLPSEIQCALDLETTMWRLNWGLLG